MIIQARMGSTRFPQKSMKELCGEPLITRILERVKRCENLDEIVLAIPDTKENIVLEEIGRINNVKVFKGSENDLVERYYLAALKYEADYVCRLPADNAAPEPKEIDKIIDFHISLKKPGFSSNLAQINGSGYPDGIGTEIFDFSLLKQIQAKESNPEKREHVHLNFYCYVSDKPVDMAWCPVNTMKCPSEYSRPDLVLDINTEEQFNFIKEMYEYLYPKKPKFTIVDIVDWYDNTYTKKVKNEQIS